MAVKKKKKNKNYNKNKSNKKNNYQRKNTVKKNNSKKNTNNKKKVNKNNNVKNVSNNIVDSNVRDIEKIYEELDVVSNDINNELENVEIINKVDNDINNELDCSEKMVDERLNIDESNVIVDLEDNNDIDIDVVNDLDENIDNRLNDNVFKNNDIFNNKKKYFNILFILVFIFVLGISAVNFPRIELSGDSRMVISYKDSYVEPGYSMKINNKDISDKISVDSNVRDGVVGEYNLEYSVDLFGVKFEKNREVIIVDSDNPVIDAEEEVINVCPNKDIPDFKYSANDEYDGDITSKIEKVINDNEIVLSVSDSSGNRVVKKILIDRVDKDSPVIKLKGSSVVFVNYGDKYVEPGYIVSDNCSDNLDNKVNVKGSVGREIGIYNLTYEVVDDSGNRSSVSRKVIVGTRVVDNGSVHNGTVYLTFDDGPNDGTTNKILDILKEEGVKATFFVTMNGSDGLITRMYNEGHTVALHTATHNYSYIYSSVDNYFNDLNRISDRVKRLTGIDSKIIRFPGGSSNNVSRNYKIGIMTELSNLVLNYGYKYFDWNVDAMDASSARNGSDVYYNVTSNLNRNRANVVLMHDTKNITATALRNIIRFGKENGYSFNKIDMNTKMVRHSVSN